MNHRDSHFDSVDSDLPESVRKNIDAVEEYYAHKKQKLSSPESAVERIFYFFGSPAYLGGVIAVVGLWIAFNLYAARMNWPQFDPPPFLWLQGLVALNGLLVMIIVLIRQNRMGGLAEQQFHLDLQVNLLTEQKTAKIIRLLEELRVDLPGVENRYDAEAEKMQTPANPHAVLTALESQQNKPASNKTGM